MFNLQHSGEQSGSVFFSSASEVSRVRAFVEDPKLGSSRFDCSLLRVCVACVCVFAPPGQVTEVCLITGACGDALFYSTCVG